MGIFRIDADSIKLLSAIVAEAMALMLRLPSSAEEAEVPEEDADGDILLWHTPSTSIKNEDDLSPYWTIGSPS